MVTLIFVRTSVTSVLGELLLTIGVVLLLFAGYELWGTDIATAREQDQLSDALEAEWAGPAVAPIDPSAPSSPAPAPGRPFLKIHIPAFGGGYTKTVLEGVDQDTLADGPGHYPGTALPGGVGNVAIAGHRVGHGAPFDQAGTLRSCDAIVLETRDTWWVYRVLPMADERADWGTRSTGQEQCGGLSPLAEPYDLTMGSEVVLPDRREVVEPVPHRPGVAPTGSLVTLTTCNPRFSARERLIVHGLLVARYDKVGQAPQWRPTELSEV